MLNSTRFGSDKVNGHLTQVHNQSDNFMTRVVQARKWG